MSSILCDPKSVKSQSLKSRAVFYGNTLSDINLKMNVGTLISTSESDNPFLVSAEGGFHSCRLIAKACDENERPFNTFDSVNLYLSKAVVQKSDESTVGIISGRKSDRGQLFLFINKEWYSAEKVMVDFLFYDCETKKVSFCGIGGGL